jgi:hypothetical protein
MFWGDPPKTPKRLKPVEVAWPWPDLGWRCPGCGSCYAPHIEKCTSCAKPEVTYANNTGEND